MTRAVPVVLMDGPAAGTTMTIDTRLLNGLTVAKQTDFKAFYVSAESNTPIPSMETVVYRMPLGEFEHASRMNHPIRMYMG